MGNSQDARSPFEPRLADAYASADSITGSIDKTGDENIQRKIGVFSTVAAGAAIVGSKRGNHFFVEGGGSALLVAYRDDDSAVSVSLS